MNTIIFAVAGYNLAETGRMLDTVNIIPEDSTYTHSDSVWQAVKIEIESAKSDLTGLILTIL